RLQVAFKTGFIARNLLVKTGILQRDREVSCKNQERLHMVFAKGVKLWTLQVQDANNFAFVNHRNRELRARFRIDHQVSWIRRDIGSEHRLAQRCRGADDAFAGGNPQFSLHALAVLDVQPVAENLLLLVVKHDAENVIVNYAFDLFGGAPKQLFNVEDRAHLATDFVQ